MTEYTVIYEPGVPNRPAYVPDLPGLGVHHSNNALSVKDWENERFGTCSG